MHFPRSLREWAREFNDDFGFEPSTNGRPTEAEPGSPEKIAILRERVDRGQHLWSAGDSSKIAIEDPGITFSYAGSERYGAVIGKDRKGHKHRYAIWTELTASESPRKRRVLYVTATASYSDNFDKDPELAAIKRHANLLGAGFVAVSPLFSARVHTERELAGIAEPVTEFGVQWIRWMAKNVGKVVICWGETPALSRHLDVLWILKRTVRNLEVYSLAEEADWPPPVNRLSAKDIFKFDIASILGDRDEMEGEPDGFDD